MLIDRTELGFRKIESLTSKELVIALLIQLIKVNTAIFDQLPPHPHQVKLREGLL